MEPTNANKSTEATQDPYNSAKNRYANIPACEFTGNAESADIISYVTIVSDDHSRVILPEITGRQGSDYINANYIDVSQMSCDLYHHCHVRIHNIATHVN